MPIRPPSFFPPFLGLLLLSACYDAIAAPATDPRWALCPVTPAGPQIPRLGRGVTQLSSDQATAHGENYSVFTGNVVVTRDGLLLEADQAEYNKQTDTLDVKGNVSFFGESVSFAGKSARLQLGKQTGEIRGARYHVPAAHAFGTAEKVEFVSAERSELKGATYTTCPPGDESWLLDSGELILDRGTNTGEAYHVTVRLGRVPVLYLPYINFPLEGRKTGFLAPSQGQSEKNGIDVAVPWYWNIAPHRDATLTPRIITKRGGMLMTEFRYLNPLNAGAVAIDVLPEDKIFDDQRSYVRWSHEHTLAPRWNAQIHFREVSDPAYLNDIENTLANSSTLYLERRFDLRYRGDGWDLLGRMQDFQPLQLGEENYQRWPQLLAKGGGPLGMLRYDFLTEYVNFQSDSLVPTGSRVDLYPGVGLPLSGAAWFLTPRIAGRYTQYDLSDATGDATPKRALPIASLDAGLFFERETTLFATPLVQTLEPRLYYLYVPFEDQDDLHLFDTSENTFSFDQLFRENRFNGPDRMGDANQVTSALTTRFLRNDDGTETLRASIGQIHYFSDRKVRLSGEPETRESSNVAGELAGQPMPGLELSAATLWDPTVEDAEQSSARIRYRPDDRHVLDAAWSYRNRGAEMGRDLLVLWPLSSHWQFLGRWYYDLVEERTLESVVGVQYESCCWAARVVTRDKPFRSSDGELQPDRSIYFTLELKGLADFGESLENVIKDGMVGL